MVSVPRQVLFSASSNHLPVDDVNGVHVLHDVQQLLHQALDLRIIEAVSLFQGKNQHHFVNDTQQDCYSRVLPVNETRQVVLEILQHQVDGSVAVVQRLILVRELRCASITHTNPQTISALLSIATFSRSPARFPHRHHRHSQMKPPLP